MKEEYCEWWWKESKSYLFYDPGAFLGLAKKQHDIMLYTVATRILIDYYVFFRVISCLNTKYSFISLINIQHHYAHASNKTKSPVHILNTPQKGGIPKEDVSHHRIHCPLFCPLLFMTAAYLFL